MLEVEMRNKNWLILAADNILWGTYLTSRRGVYKLLSINIFPTNVGL